MRQINRLVTTALAVLLVSALVGAAVAPAAANHSPETETNSGSVMDTLFSGNDDGGIVDTTRGMASGIGDRVGYRVSTLNPFAELPTAQQHAVETTDTFNQYNESYVEYVNNRSANEVNETLADRKGAVEIHFIDEDDNKAVRYLVIEMDSDGAGVRTLEMVNETSVETGDEPLVLKRMAAANAAEEIERFHDEFVVPNEDPDRQYMSEMASKYWRHVGNVDNEEALAS